MAQPSQSDVFVNAPLGNIAVAYLQNQAEFISGRVFPTVPVQKQGGLYFVYPKDQWFRSDAQPRGVSQESAGSGYTLDTDDYNCRVYALHKDIDDQVRANAGPPINLDSDATEFTMRGLLLKKEADWAAKYFQAATWTGSSTGNDIIPAVKWDQPNSFPIKDIRAQITASKLKTGIKPNKLVLGDDVWDAIADNSDLLDRIKVTDTRMVTTQLLATILGLQEVLVAGGIQNTAPEGAVPIMSGIFAGAALLCYAAPAPSLMAPSAGYTFAWTGYLGASADGTRIKRMRMEPIASDRIEGEMAYDQKLVAADLGVFFTPVLT